jgi:hypothetical protein
MALLKWEEKRLVSEVQHRRQSRIDSMKSTMLSFRRKGEPGTKEFNKLHISKKRKSLLATKKSKARF